MSLVLVLGVLTLALIRKGGLKLWHAGVAWLFGFYFSETEFAPAVKRTVAAVVRAMFS